MPKSALKQIYETVRYGKPQNSSGKYVDQHQTPSQAKGTGRNYNIYDQRRQESVARPKMGNVSSKWKPRAAIYGGGAFLFEVLIFPWLLGHFPFPFEILWPLIAKSIIGYILRGILFGLIIGAFTYLYYQQENYMNTRYLKHTKMMLDDPDTNNQSFIDIPEEEPKKYDIAPDTKVHFPQDVTSVLSHIMIDNKGIHGKDGKVHFDNHFSQRMFDMANVPQSLRKIYNAKDLFYNPKDNRIYGKLDGNTVADHINKYWHVPKCEDPNSQNPAGVYIVSTKPENTVVAAETRAGKGQHVIEETIDIWSREDHQPNIVATDLKMELLRQFLKTLTLRGYNVKALNLLVASKTDAINFIGYAVNAAIRGDVTQMQQLVTNLAHIYFPNKGSDNPMWTQAAGAVFARTVMGLIDYYYEQVQSIKNSSRYSLAQIMQKSDEAWGHVSLYNSYRFIVDTASKMYPKNTYEEIYPKDKKGNFLDPDPDATQKSGLTIYFDATAQLPQNSIREKIAEQNGAIKITGKSERTMASIYSETLFGMIFFTDSKVIHLTSARPSQNLDMKGFAFPRRLAVHFNKYYLKRHSYKGAITHWQCFHDPQMTKPYPDKDFSWSGAIDSYGWADMYIKGKLDNGHVVETKIANKLHPGHFIMRKLYQKSPTYIRLTVVDPASAADKTQPDLVLGTYDFIFTKDYRRTMSGNTYAVNPITKKREISGGHMQEYNYIAATKRVKPIITHFNRKVYSLNLNIKKEDARAHPHTRKFRIIDDYDIHYSDKPTALFLVAPPSTPAYNKLLLNTIDLLYNEQVSSAFLGQQNEKPFYVTKYMLDEFGNMQSDGQGVPALGNKLTSGLAQGQQFTMILQSMEQLKSIYGNEVAQILQANVGTFFFIKSKDVSLINLLIGMNGKKVVVDQNNQSFSRPIGGYHLKSEFKFSKKGADSGSKPMVDESFSKKSKSLLDTNAYLHLNNDVTDGNAIVSRGSSTIVSKGPSILPMSAMLYGDDKGKHHTGGYGNDMVNTNMPMLSDAGNVNPLANIPDFTHMIAQRIEEAKMAPKVLARYRYVHNYNDQQMRKIDRDELANEIMQGIRDNIRIKDKAHEDEQMEHITKAFDAALTESLNNQYQAMNDKEETQFDDKSSKIVISDINKVQNHPKTFAKEANKRLARAEGVVIGKGGTVDLREAFLNDNATKNTDFEEVQAKNQNKYNEVNKKRYAGGRLSRHDVTDARYLEVIRQAFGETVRNGAFTGYMQLRPNKVGTQDAYSSDGQTVYATNDNSNGLGWQSWHLTPAFFNFICKFSDWNGFSLFNTKVEQYYDIQKKNEDES